MARPSYGHSLSFLDRPTADAGGPAGTGWDSVGSMIGPSTSPWGPDTAHQPSFSYIPYLVTGDLFYLEECYFWASHNVMNPCLGDDTGSREFGKGIIYGDGQSREGVGAAECGASVVCALGCRCGRTGSP